MAATSPHRHGLGSWSATGVGTSSGVTVTHTIAPGAGASYVTSAQVSGDAAALVTIESPAGTVLVKHRYTAAFVASYTFPTAVPGAAGQNILVKISASTSNCEANIQGYDK